MSLHARCEKGSRAIPGWSFCTVFPATAEWQTVGAAFSAYPQLYIDLPGHGGSREVRVSGLPRLACGWRKRWRTIMFGTTG
jgi:2-succinyl-6-hydroxy-2,4-cyclohexadiene-1-carboxylate synthase